MALPPKLKGHRLTFTDSVAYAASYEPLHTLEFYLDYVCPFSAKMFNTLTNVTTHIRANPELRTRLQIIFRQQIQPWHPSSTLVHEAALAVQRLTAGDAGKFWIFSADLFRNQASFFDEAVVNETRSQTYRRLARLAAESVGVDEAEMCRLLEVKQGQGGDEAKNAGNAVTGDVKTIVKMARLTGVHVTPTVLFNGVVVGEISSGWSETQWEEWLERNIV
ncbi:hypothetical protein C8A01DRAFT_40726 [Parachaetomium inaequale]|uniref:Thioredoxin-like fold domain-containing protein n=1 Tax=Parachaetomium inaequale TaxID=2588326 RepID=A0AAN6P717_9PEZI|nr:hypothetical protein C8A01DRAFT_40726 [Parachaetomium inaequale]